MFWRTDLPEWLDACWKQARERIQNAAGVDNDKQDRQTHCSEHDTKSRADNDQFPQTKSIFALDGPEEVEGGEYPPRVPMVRRHKRPDQTT